MLRPMDNFINIITKEHCLLASSCHSSSDEGEDMNLKSILGQITKAANTYGNMEQPKKQKYAA